MDGWTVCRNGVDAVVYIAIDDTQYSGTWLVVYLGGWIVLYNWCDILSVAQNEILARGVAPVCNRRQRVFLFCCSVRLYFGFIGVFYVVCI